jgi:hypothetical protein
MGFIKPVWVSFEGIPAELGTEIDHLPVVFSIWVITRVAIDEPAAQHWQFWDFLGFHEHPLIIKMV